MKQVNYIDQRDTYKLVEKLISGTYTDVFSMLKSIVTDIVDLSHFEINGGRIWELDPEHESYRLRFQYGKFNKIPEEYEIKIKEQPILKELTQKRVMLSNETDFVLKQLGIKLYSVIGVGEVIKLKSGRYYEYVIGFNAPEIHQTFFELLNIIAGVTTKEIVNLRNALRLQQEMDSSKRIRQDLAKASEIQRQLLPPHSIEFYDYDIFGYCQPSEGVSGDYFDYIIREDIEDDTLGIVISDAASKGLPAAIQSLFVSGAIKMGLSYATRISDNFNKLNTLIFDTFVYERFVTLFYCELTLSQNRLVLYVNAGHPGPIHYRPTTDTVKTLDPTGGILGILRHQKFGLENVRMQKGDIMVLYTDGITEAMNDDDELFGEERLIEIIRKNHKKTAKEINLLILEAVQKFYSESKYTDDRTIVVIKRKTDDETSEKNNKNTN